MRTEKPTLLLFLLFSTTLFNACEKETVDPDPSKAILGKWECIEYGDQKRTPSGYREFLTDSIYRYFDYETNAYYFKEKYWIKDSMLYMVGFRKPDGEQIYSEYKYTFLNSKKLQLDLQMHAIYTISIYRKID
jgi:hypothetical protein